MRTTITGVELGSGVKVGSGVHVGAGVQVGAMVGVAAGGWVQAAVMMAVKARAVTETVAVAVKC